MMDASMLLDETIVHKLFGKGIVTATDGRYLEVKFFIGNKKSRFVYPFCFHDFLSLENNRKQAEAEKDVEQWKVENGIVQKEQLKLRHEKTVAAINARKAAASEKIYRPRRW